MKLYRIIKNPKDSIANLIGAVVEVVDAKRAKIVTLPADIPKGSIFKIGSFIFFYSMDNLEEVTQQGV